MNSVWLELQAAKLPAKQMRHRGSRPAQLINLINFTLGFQIFYKYNQM